MKTMILEVLRKAKYEMRAREIAAEIDRWTMCVSVELREMEKEGLVVSTLHNDWLNGESYFTWRMA